MTAMFPSFYAKPNLLKLGLFPKMSLGELALYEYLIEMCDKRSSRQFKVDPKDVFERTGISERTLITSRKKLLAKGLILYRLHVYEVCDPETLKPFPGDPKIPPPKKSKSPDPQPPMPKEPDAASESKPKMRTEGVDLSDVDFPYGWNLITRPAEQPKTYGFDAVFAAS